jgi:hypothetical protein
MPRFGAFLLWASYALAQSPLDSFNNRLPHWLRFSGEERVRAEGFFGGAFREGNDDLYLLQRTRFDMYVVPAGWLQFRFETQDARVFWKSQKPYASPFQDTWDLRLAFVTIGDFDQGRVSLLVGRQALVFGEERLVGQNNWTNTARTFDAARLRVRYGKARVDLFAASVVMLRDGQVGEVTPANNLYGVYASFENTIPNSTIEPYAFWRLSRSVKMEVGGLGNLDVKTTGVRWVGKIGETTDYNMEVAIQRGEVGRDRVAAWAGHWVLGHTFKDAKWKPRILGEYNYATGDANSRDGRQGTFDQLYPTAHDKYGLADQVGWKNIHHLRTGVDWKPSPKFGFGAKFNAYWLADAHDGLYNTSSTLLVRDTTGAAGRFVGTELDATALWSPVKAAQIGAGFAHLFPGTFLNRTTPGHSYTGPYIFLNFVF